jgi:hypothetical protein
MLLKGGAARWLGTVLVGGSGLLAGPALAGGADGAESAFVPGSGTAAARLVRLAPRTASLEFGISGGVARADYQGASLARAETQTLDLGLIGLVLTTGSCGGDAPLAPDQLPQPFRVDSRQGAREERRQVAGGDIVGAGNEAVQATPGAASAAEISGAFLRLGDAFSVTRGVSRTEAQLVPGRGRRAGAQVDLDEVVLAGGAVRLAGLHWRADHETGANSRATGGFSVARLEIAGRVLPTDTPAALAAAFEQAGREMAGRGLRLSAPQLTGTASGGVQVTPLVVSAGGSDSAAPLLGPAVAAAQPVRDGANERVGGCKGPGGKISAGLGGAYIVVDGVLAGLTGSGGAADELGGVSVATEGATFDDPFGLRLPGPVGTGGPAPVADPATAHAPREPEAEAAEADGGFELSIGSPVAVASRPPAARQPTAPTPAVAADTSPVAAGGPSMLRCVSTHPAGGDGCRTGRGAAAGTLAAALVAGLFALDWRRSRRARLRRPGPTPGTGSLTDPEVSAS